MATESGRSVSIADRARRFSVLRSAAIKRIRYLEYLAWFRGWVSRKDLMDRFDIGPTAASSDFSTYTEAYKANLIYDLKQKRYTCAQSFRPAFHHNLERVLHSLSEASVDGGPSGAAHIPVATAPNIQRPMAADVVAAISRAISTRSEVHASYVSLSTGEAERRLVPLALVTDGFQWRVRCKDREKDFRDYMLVRFESVRCGTWGSGADVALSDDAQWKALVEMRLRPHPKNRYQDAVRRSFDFDSDDTLRVQARVSELGYLIRQWPIDVTRDALLEGSAYQLHLANSHQLREQIRAVQEDSWILDALVDEQEEIAKGQRR